MLVRSRVFLFLSVIIISLISVVGANSYVSDLYFNIPESVFVTNERIELKGYVFQSNYTDNGTLVTASSNLPNANVNFTILNSSRTRVNNYTFTTDSNGSFYSKSNFYTSANEINASANEGIYYLRAEYKDLSNTTSYSEVEISVINKTVDETRISAEKANYNPSEKVSVVLEAVKLIGDQVLYQSNVSLNGSIRNASKYILDSFNCTTGANGKCNINITAPSTYGHYFLEVGDFKDFSSFVVVPFHFNVYMKDELGQSLKNVYSYGEQAKIEVSVVNASSSEVYNFSGYISDSSGNVIKSVNNTQLNNNNSFTNSFLFDVDSLTFNYGSYGVNLGISKVGDGSISASTSFEVQSWKLNINKKEINSGFEYEYSVFPNKTMRLEAIPSYRNNGSVISDINHSYFSAVIKDSLDNTFSSSPAFWNSSCGSSGCYEFALTSPLSLGKYSLELSLSNSGYTQTTSRTLTVINGVLTAKPSNSRGILKELFGTNEFVYFSFDAHNSTASQFNLSDSEVFSVKYMNGSEFNYTQVSNFSFVNATNNVYEWAWNSTTQLIKMDVPSYGGVYDVAMFGDNRTVGTSARFIVNPYDTCIVPKDTPGQVSSGNYYVWQFKTSDTIYFELKIKQANNPTGRAGASNFTSENNASYQAGSACNVDTTTQQVVTNASVSILNVRNVESGILESFNASASNCQASDSSGTYSCTLKPLSNWEGGNSVVEFNVQGQDGTNDVAYGRFEARAFYLYGWSNNWQVSPSSNLSLSLRLYEAGSGWWGSGGGLSGTVSVKKVEYQGRDGEWIWPPVDSGYNISQVNSTSITNGAGTLSLPSSSAPGGVWKTGYYRALLEGTTFSGNTDYGYAWFGVKLWDVYGTPIECDSNGCSYKNYFNSKENITLYMKISKAGTYNYNAQGGDSIYGNVSIKVKKIQDCRTWPCKDLNESLYSANSINVNQSNAWYWNANIINNSNYIIQINTTTGSWGTGYYSVVLDVNGTDTGNAWFNTLAFYVESSPTDYGGTNYTYNIKGNSPMYFNVTSVKNYKQGYWFNNSYVKYSVGDYVNATISDLVLRSWDSINRKNIEYNYPEDLNITPLNTSVGSGNILMNLTYNNGTWPSGYYYGEITLNNSDGETSSGWIGFGVKPFRVAISTNGNYNLDSDQCANFSLNIYEPTWSSNIHSNSNYSITSVYEDVWSGSSSSRISYTNYTNVSFVNSSSILVCPNSDTGQWGSGSWGGYHYLNVIVKDNALNNSEVGWLSFRSVPFSVSWGSVNGGSNHLSTTSISVPVSITKASSGANASGNITRLYQWRYDSTYNGEQDYVFSVGSCYSNVSGQCTVNGTANVTIYAPSGGWVLGYNYIYANWMTPTSSTSIVEDWSGIYIEGKEPYGGYFSNTGSTGNYWKYDFANTENITIKLSVQDIEGNAVDVNISDVQYAPDTSNCWNVWCRSYTSGTWSLVGGGVQTSNGSGVITIKPPSGGWTLGYNYIKATVSGSSGSASVTGGGVRIKDLIGPNITITSPVNNLTITNTSLAMRVTTTENSNCDFNAVNFDLFQSWNCGGVTSSNSSNGTLTNQTIGACNSTLYSYNGTQHRTIYISNNYFSDYNGTNYIWFNGNTGLSTGGTTHTYSFNVTNWTDQYYGVKVSCADSDYNYKTELVTVLVNNTIT